MSLILSAGQVKADPVAFFRSRPYTTRELLEQKSACVQADCKHSLYVLTVWYVLRWTLSVDSSIIRRHLSSPQYRGPSLAKADKLADDNV